MKGIALVALFAVAGIALWKHRLSLTLNPSVGSGTTEAGSYPSGVSAYPGGVAPQKLQQIYATQKTNPDAIFSGDYAAPFGPDENQAQSGEIIF